jgi:hypothetical protein
MLVIAADMSRQGPLHKRAEGLRGFGLDYEVEVIGHQAETEEHHRMFGLSRGKEVEKGAVLRKGDRLLFRYFARATTGCEAGNQPEQFGDHRLPVWRTEGSLAIDGGPDA